MLQCGRNSELLLVLLLTTNMSVSTVSMDAVIKALTEATIDEIVFANIEQIKACYPIRFSMKADKKPLPKDGRSLRMTEAHSMTLLMDISDYSHA